jgi:UDP-N-acetylmuramoylalanine--D-glutamate ligase
MKLKDLKKKSILILGFGQEGRDVFNFLKKNVSGIGLSIADKNIKDFNLKNVKIFSGEDYLNSIKFHEVIIRSPGISFKVIDKYLSKKNIVTSATEIFLSNCPGKVIGITGTKGKGTVSSLIYTILKEGGFKTKLVGNIGVPALGQLDLKDNKILYVYEMSSHQLYRIKKSPNIALFINVSQAHLDYFKDFKDYVSSKSNITKYQKKDDIFIYNPRDKIVKEIAEKTKAIKIPFPKNPKEVFPDINLENNFFAYDFNLENLSASLVVAKLFKIPVEKVNSAIRKFKPLPYRLEYTGKYKNIIFYNDSASTVPESAVGAIKALGENVESVILGGYENKASFDYLAKTLIDSNVKNLILFLPSGNRILKTIKKIDRNRNFNIFFPNNMEEAVKLCYEKTKKGKICLLSPGVPSFGLFKNYLERGNMFKKYVKKYGKE